MNKYKLLGESLRSLRRDQGLSITDLADGLGVDRTHVSKLENGHERPSDELLLKIIKHFLLSRDKAVKLWHEAGYSDSSLVLSEKGERSSNTMGKVEDSTSAPLAEQPVGMNVNINRERVPILFADAVYVLSNDTGLVLDFAQGAGPTPQQHVVSSMGMSKEQAKRLIQAMKDNLGIE